MISKEFNICESEENSMQNIVIFIEPNEDAFIKSEKIANMYMNRFFIDEDDRNELLEIIELGKIPHIPNEKRYSNTYLDKHIIEKKK